MEKDIMTKPTDYDVIICGAGVAGTTCALALNAGGLSVLLIERCKHISDYKKLCTHFIQPFSVPILYELGLDGLLDTTHSVRTKARFLVPEGIIDPSSGYKNTSDQPDSWAYNIERRVMDPFLREHVLKTDIDFALGTSLAGIQCNDNGYEVDVIRDRNPTTYRTHLFIAADGRESKTAKLLNIPAETYDNDRMAFFCYAKGIDAPKDNRSLFSLREQEMSFLYPLIDGRTLLSVYIQKERAEQWSLTGNEFYSLLNVFKHHMPELDFSHANLDSPMYGYRRYENQIRPAVFQNVSFIGDSCLSLDPMSGVGCGFALKSASLLANEIINTGISTADQRATTLEAYQTQHHAFFQPHAQGIIADAKVGKSSEVMASTYQTMIDDEKLARAFVDLTGRLITPEQFQRAFLLATALAKSKAKHSVGV
jgi:flavin-dependent dehydrogenase